MRMIRSERAERAAENGGQVVGAIADDGLGAQRDAERTQPVGNRERVGVEPVRPEHLRTDGNDLGRGERLHQRSISPGAMAMAARSARFA